MFKSKKITAIAVALLLAVCLTGGTVAALAASTNSKGNGYVNEREDAALTDAKQKDEIALDANGNPADPGGRGSRLEINANPSVAAQGENVAVQKGSSDVDEQEDAALTAKKQNGEIALDANGNPAAPGGRGSRLR
jgi:hypothetical protein